MLRYDRQSKPGLVALYDIRPGNGAGPFLQPQSPHRAKISTEVAHVTRDSDTTFRVKRSPGRFTHRGLSCETGAAVTTRTYWRGKLLLRCICSAAHKAPTG